MKNLFTTILAVAVLAMTTSSFAQGTPAACCAKCCAKKECKKCAKDCSTCPKCKKCENCQQARKDKKPCCCAKKK